MEIKAPKGYRLAWVEKDGSPVFEPKKPYITGPYGCKCHPFNSWAESDRVHSTKYQVGDRVKRRCNLWEGRRRKKAITGTVISIEGGGFFIVEYGPLPRDRHLEHAAMLRYQ